MTLEHAVTRALRAGNVVTDSIFDRVYPPAIQFVSSGFWTPVATAVTASEFLRALDSKSVLDVGAGVGKFCIVSSLALDRRTTGVEHRAHLVDVARSAAAEYGADVDWVSAPLEAIDPERFDAFYFFNPFAENVFDADDCLDRTVELSEERWFRDLALVERWLDLAPQDTSIVTYNGFGGRIPESFRLRRRTRVGGSWLRVWTKYRPGRAQGFFVEVDEGVLSSRDLEALANQLVDSDSPAAMLTLIERPLGSPVDGPRVVTRRA